MQIDFINDKLDSLALRLNETEHELYKEKIKSVDYERLKKDLSRTEKQVCIHVN